MVLLLLQALQANGLLTDLAPAVLMWQCLRQSLTVAHPNLCELQDAACAGGHAGALIGPGLAYNCWLVCFALLVLPALAMCWSSLWGTGEAVQWRQRCCCCCCLGWPVGTCHQHQQQQQLLALLELVLA
jgi:hypothetical protein